MKPERGREQHAEPVWKHERGGGVAGTRRRVRARSGEEHASGRQERSWKGRKCGGENRYDYQGNSQKKTPLGRKRQRSVEQTKRKKSREEREWEDGEGEKKKKSIE